MNDFRRIIHAKVEVLPCEIERVMEGSLDVTYIINIPLETWRVCGIVDDTCIKTCRPESGPINHTPHAPRRVGSHQIQRAFYSGYLQQHGLKYQTLLLPTVCLVQYGGH